MDSKKISHLEKEKERIQQMGGPDAVAKQQKRGKLTARDRVASLFDSDSFEEIGLHAEHVNFSPANGKSVPADGVITGFGKIEGRDVFCIAYDFTVMAGTMGRIGEAKCERIRELALRHRRPIVWIIDSAGARVQELGGSFFSTTGSLFREQVRLSGVVPQVSIIAGTGAAGTAYIPALSDCVIMVKESGSLALGGPPLVEAVLGEKVTEQELGGWEVHNSRSGVSHFSADSDEDAINIARRYLSFFPSHCNEQAPRLEVEDRGPLDDAVLSIVPDEPQSPFDMKEVIAHLTDAGQEPLYYMDAFGGSVLTGWIRMGGFAVGVVASQSMVLGGVLENDSSVKAARFISLCDAFQIPLLFLQDVPGFLVGSRVEKNGIIRHGAKMLFAVSQATVPKMTVIIRKAYGAGYFVMCGKGFEPDYIAAWPTAEIALMGAEGAINILYGKKLSALPPEERSKQRRALEDGYRADVNAYSAAARFGIDDVIDPRHTVQRLVRVLELTRNKERPKHPGMHGIFPV